jgi:hypothetical protein
VNPVPVIHYADGKDNDFFHVNPHPMPPEPSENPGQRQYCKGSRYTVKERKILAPYKDAFRSQESKAGRLQILKCDILPTIFNYWVSIETAPMDEEESCMCAKVNYQACSKLYC